MCDLTIKHGDFPYLYVNYQRENMSNNIGLCETSCHRCLPPWDSSIADPICSVYGRCTDIHPKNDPYVDKYSIHGAYGNITIESAASSMCAQEGSQHCCPPNHAFFSGEVSLNHHFSCFNPIESG